MGLALPYTGAGSWTHGFFFSAYLAIMLFTWWRDLGRGGERQRKTG